MASLTAVELGADICALARTSIHGGAVRVSDAEWLDPAAFPGGGTFTLALRQSRKRMKLPRRCRVVLWGMPDGASRRDPAVKPRLAPLEGAGFRVERVVSPCNALAALAPLKAARGENATCWLAINRGGVAIVVVRPGKQLYAHSFIWDSTVGATGSQARLLQRYSLVSFLSPEVKRAMAAARQQGTPVDAIVTCGNLPDLRSMTMPLIEELDVEVETLDSLDGLEVAKDDVDRLAEVAPAIRLACAGAVARSSRPWDKSRKWKSQLERAVLYAAVAGGILAVGYVWYAKTRAPAPPPFTPSPAPASPPKVSRTTEPRRGAPPAATVPSQPPPQKTAPPAQSPPAQTPATTRPVPPSVPAAGRPTATAGTPASQPQRSATPPSRPATGPPPVTDRRPETPPPKPTTPSRQPADPARKPADAPERPAAAAGRQGQPAQTKPQPPKPEPPARQPAAQSQPPRRQPPPAPATASQAPKAASQAPKVNTPAVPADKPGAGDRPQPPRLQDPVPRITSILISFDRRYATLEGGQILGIGDVLGRRTVVSIDERSVVFREPSGVQIRVGFGGRILGVGPGGL